MTPPEQQTWGQNSGKEREKEGGRVSFSKLICSLVVPEPKVVRQTSLGAQMSTFSDLAATQVKVQSINASSACFVN